MVLAPSLLSRLYKDLAELHDSPYPGVTVFIDDADVRKLCLVLTPPSGPWKNLALHFDVELPMDWPLTPPRVSCSLRGIRHPNLYGSYVCCDLLKQEYEIYRDNGYTGGYTPALTLRGLFLQFLTFFSSSKVDQDYGGTIDIGEHFRVWYACESDLIGRRLPVTTNPQIPGSLFSDPVQSALRTEWESDGNPIVVIHRDMTEVGPLTQTAKSPRPGPNRIHRVEVRNPRWADALKAIRQWKCKRCPYGSHALPHCTPVAAEEPTNVEEYSPLLTPPAVCQLDLLDDDVLYTLTSHLPSESVISFSAAYPRLHGIVQSTHVLLQRELRCFFLRTPLSDSVLGIGVSLDFRSRTLASNFDWLSQRAFDEFGVRRSIEKRDFSFFLPLAFSESHFERVYPIIWRRLEEIDAEVQKAENTMSRNPRRRAPGPPRKQEMVGVVYRMMTNIVVSLMKSCDDAFTAKGNSKTLLHASEKAVVSYCHLFHLLMCLCRQDPEILREATDRLRRFITTKDLRVKTHVPDLGELIIFFMLVMSQSGNDSPIKWSSLAGPLLEEAVIRNVRWTLKDAPHLEVLEQGPSDYRLAETFFRSKTSLRLIMFQITFLNLFLGAYGSGISRLDDNYGFPAKALPIRMVEEIKQIYEINTWPAFFKRVRFEQGVGFGKARCCELLRAAVRTSAARKYHTEASPQQLTHLRNARNRVEQECFRR